MADNMIFAKLRILAALMILISPFLVWESVWLYDYYGDYVVTYTMMDDRPQDGWLDIIFAIIMLVLSARQLSGKRSSYDTIAYVIFCFLMGIQFVFGYLNIDLDNRYEDVISATPGIGFWLLTIGVILSVVFFFMDKKQPDEPVQEPSTQFEPPQ